MTTTAPSSELRTSVLNAAIDLGFRTSVFAKWMIDPVDEEGAVGEVSFNRVTVPAGWVLENGLRRRRHDVEGRGRGTRGDV